MLEHFRANSSIIILIGEGNGIPLQHSCLENPMDRGAWWATRPQGHKESDTTEVTEHACMWFLVQSLVSLTSKSHLIKPSIASEPLYWSFKKNLNPNVNYHDPLSTCSPELNVQMKVKVAQSSPTLCDPVEYTVHGILQARVLEWVAFPFSRGSSQPRD